ncbi:hypothetical protein PIB30_011418 [Stylosanthes scabra]|uniref:Uncharacterized protein n=1 Tax=Stylosanthes scabra TaxID=79078 RepID=A0ABU6Q6S4_9FABA|nr:hypothetical protein [Stylosanthes scabra]
MQTRLKSVVDRLVQKIKIPVKEEAQMMVKANTLPVEEDKDIVGTPEVVQSHDKIETLKDVQHVCPTQWQTRLKKEVLLRVGRTWWQKVNSAPSSPV